MPETNGVALVRLVLLDDAATPEDPKFDVVNDALSLTELCGGSGDLRRLIDNTEDAESTCPMPKSSREITVRKRLCADSNNPD